MTRTTVKVSGVLTLEDTDPTPGPTPTPPFPFRLGETEPTSQNAFTPSAVVGPRVPETSLENYAGDLTNISEGDRVDRLVITGRVKPTTSGWVLRDCLIAPGEPDPVGADPMDRNDLVPALDMRGVPAAGGTVEFVEVRPSYRSHEMYGFKGGNVLVRRSVIVATTDGVQVHGSGTYPNDTPKFLVLAGCLIGGLRTFADPNQSDGWTHNDVVQAFGSVTNLEIVGCALYGGRTSCILIQQQSGLYQTVTIDRNWLYGNHDVGSTINTSQNGRGVICAGGALTITGNRVAQAGKSPAILIASDTLKAPTTTISGNVYMETGEPVPISSGANRSHITGRLS